MVFSLVISESVCLVSSGLFQHLRLDDLRVFFPFKAVDEGVSFATLPRARLAYAGPAPERSHSLTDLSEAPLSGPRVFVPHGMSSLQRCAGGLCVCYRHRDAS